MELDGMFSLTFHSTDIKCNTFYRNASLVSKREICLPVLLVLAWDVEILSRRVLG